MEKQKDDWTLTEALHYEHGRGDPFAAAVRSTRMPMIITDPNQPDNPIVFANMSFQDLTGYGRDELIGRNCRFLQGPGTDRQTVASVRKTIAQGNDASVDLLNYRKDGTPFWNTLYVSPVRDTAGTIRFFFASQMDITDRIDRQDRVSREKAVVEAEVAKRVSELREAVEAQQLLLHEVDHRVKNNMTMIGSILRMELRAAGDAKTARMLRLMMSRVDAISTVHRNLYQDIDVTRFDIGSYAVGIASDLAQHSAGSRLRVRADLHRAEIPAGQASALGLVVNEILNHMVQARSEASDRCLDVSAQAEGSRVQLTFRISNAQLEHTEDSYSPSGVAEQIITRLASQSHTSVDWKKSDAGDLQVTLSITRDLS